MVTIRDLVKNSLRMRPDRIIVGECRAGETLDMLQAMNTGIEGSMSTVHANSPKDAFARLEAMVLMSDIGIPSRVIQKQLASAVKMVVQVTRLQDGSRRIVNISEVRGTVDGRVDVHDVFHFERTGLTDLGKVQGRFVGCGEPPKVMERLKIHGISLPPTVFNENIPVNL